MKFTQLRNATVIIEYAGKRMLVDPMLAPKGTHPAFAGTPNSDKRNPLVDLPITMDDVVAVDAVIVTHTHLDHWDGTAEEVLPKDIPIFAQHEQDAQKIEAAGFRDVRILNGETELDGIRLVKTPGQHGSDYAIETLGQRLGQVCGVVFQHPQEKTLYLAGDTVWNQYVAANLEQYRPEVVILNSGDARIDAVGPIIMGKQDVYEVHRAAPDATIIASHMEAVNHAMLSRQELRAFLAEKGMTGSVLVPEDGEAYRF